MTLFNFVLICLLAVVVSWHPPVTTNCTTDEKVCITTFADDYKYCLAWVGQDCPMPCHLDSRCRQVQMHPPQPCPNTTCTPYTPTPPGPNPPPHTSKTMQVVLILLGVLALATIFGLAVRYRHVCPCRQEDEEGRRPILDEESNDRSISNDNYDDGRGNDEDTSPSAPPAEENDDNASAPLMEAGGSDTSPIYTGARPKADAKCFSLDSNSSTEERMATGTGSLPNDGGKSLVGYSLEQVKKMMEDTREERVSKFIIHKPRLN